MRLSRRKMARLMLAAPLAAAAQLGLAGRGRTSAAEEQAGAPPDEGPTPLGRFLSKQDPGLTGAEKKRVRRLVAQIEQALETLRAYPLGNDVPPSGAFRALRSK